MIGGYISENMSSLQVTNQISQKALRFGGGQCVKHPRRGSRKGGDSTISEFRLNIEKRVVVVYPTIVEFLTDILTCRDHVMNPQTTNRCDRYSN